MAPLSDAYFECLEESKDHHLRNSSFGGDLCIPHAERIKEIIDRLDCRSVLDYGCGKGNQYRGVIERLGARLEDYWGVPVAKYDPAWKRFEQKPAGKFDLVICTHTLGTIPQVDLPIIIDRLYRYAKKAIYVGEIIGEIRKKVFSRPEIMPFYWSPDRWKEALRRPVQVEVTIHFDRNIPEGPEPSLWRSVGHGFERVLA